MSVLLGFDPRADRRDRLGGRVAALAAGRVDGRGRRRRHAHASRSSSTARISPRSPSALGSTRRRFVARHNAAPLRVLATGFAPGFVYCGFHPEPLARPAAHDRARQRPRRHGALRRRPDRDRGDRDPDRLACHRPHGVPQLRSGRRSADTPPRPATRIASRRSRERDPHHPRRAADHRAGRRPLRHAAARHRGVGPDGPRRVRAGRGGAAVGRHRRHRVHRPVCVRGRERGAAPLSPAARSRLTVNGGARPWRSGIDARRSATSSRSPRAPPATTAMSASIARSTCRW